MPDAPDFSNLAPNALHLPKQEHLGALPPHFVWGVSTAAYQIEGGHNADGKGPSIWDDFTARNKRKLKGQNGNIATDFYNRYQADLDLMASLGIQHFRLSLSWSRILPTGLGQANQKGLDFYHRVIDAALQRGITPWLTLYHWDLPQALEAKGGWTNRDVVSWFSDFSHLAATSFGSKIANWMIMNEPMVFTGAGYFLGLHAPGRRGFKNFLPAMHHATLSMAAGGRVLRAVLPPTAQIGTTFSASWVEAFSPSEKDVTAARKADALLNRLYLEPTLGLGYPVADLPPLREVERYMRPDDEASMAFDFDFHGLQLYTREVVKHSFFTPYLHAKLVHPKARGQAHTVMNWEVYPLALRLMLHRWSGYGKMRKIFVTENGAAFQDSISASGQIDDSDRTAYLQSHIAQMLQAKAEGVPVEGYFIWTFTDNFEWAEGYKPRFGLVHIDFETQKRTIKASGQWYASLLSQQKAAASQAANFAEATT